MNLRPLSGRVAIIAPMNMTTIIVLNTIVAIGLLTALAMVMHLGHRVAGAKPADAAPRSRPRELARTARPDLERAA